MLGRTFSNLGRLRQITTIVARHGLDHFLKARRFFRKATEEAPEQPEAELIPALAKRFRAILEELGPTFIKFGQVLSTRPDLLPPGFAQALETLQDNCPAMSEAELREAAAKGLGLPVDKAFSQFDIQPIASASIAQVHHAVTLDGHEVAVKVQRPRIRERILNDLDILAYLARLAEAIIEETGFVTPRLLVDEFEDAILNELDFVHEAENIRRFYANAQQGERTYVVPRLYDQLSSKTVLTMEFIRGARLNALGPEHDRHKIARNVVAAAFEQLFVDGLFHADPHPGNAFVLPDNRLALLDFGSVGQISYGMRETLAVLAVAIAMRDSETVAQLLYRVGIPDNRISLFKLRDACATLFDSYLHAGVSLKNVKASLLLGDLYDLASRFRIRLPSEYAVLARASTEIEGVVRQLDPELEVLDAAQPYLHKLVEERLSPGDIGDTTLKNLVRAGGMLRQLPLTAAQILMDLENGKLQLNIENKSLDAAAKSLDTLGLSVFTGLVAAALVGASMLLFGEYHVELWHVPVVPTLGLLVAGMLAFAIWTRYLVAPRLRKISVATWLRRRQRRR